MSGDQAHEVDLLSAQVARLLGVSQATVTRIPKDRLDYWTTPGGHRRYRRRDVEAYARNWLGRDLQA
jgi:excisionase family DNA binding protein